MTRAAVVAVDRADAGSVAEPRPDPGVVVAGEATSPRTCRSAGVGRRVAVRAAVAGGDEAAGAPRSRPSSAAAADVVGVAADDVDAGLGRLLRRLERHRPRPARPRARSAPGPWPRRRDAPRRRRSWSTTSTYQLGTWSAAAGVAASSDACQPSSSASVSSTTTAFAPAAWTAAAAPWSATPTYSTFCVGSTHAPRRRRRGRRSRASSMPAARAWKVRRAARVAPADPEVALQRPGDAGVDLLLDAELVGARRIRGRMLPQSIRPPAVRRAARRPHRPSSPLSRCVASCLSSLRRHIGRVGRLSR